MIRPYTGFDKYSTGPLPGLKALRDVILYLNAGKITHLGSWTPYGRGWRCDRGVWRNYTSPLIKGAPGGKWIHLEISPTMANDKARMDKAIAEALT